MTKPTTSAIDYNVMTAAIANAALSRRAALQIELAVSLVHFTQENGGTDATGKANLKAVYHAAGYLCMTKADRDYKTVNRRLNAMAKVFDKMGSSLVHGWIENKGDTDSVLAYVQTELEVFGFDTMDDVLDYVGVTSNKTRAPRQTSGPVVASAPVEAPAPAAEPAPAPVFDAEAVKAAILANMSADEIREFVTGLLVHVAAQEVAEESAPVVEAAAVEAAVSAAIEVAAPVAAPVVVPMLANVPAKVFNGKRKGKQQSQRAA